MAIPSIQEKAIKLINNQINKLDKFSIWNSSTIPQWKDRTIRMLKGLIVNEELELFANIETDDWETEVEAYKNMLKEFIEGVQETPDFFFNSKPTSYS